MELIAYEGGQHLAGANPSVQGNNAITQLFTQANGDSRMGDAYLAYLADWQSQGGCLFMNYTLVQREYNRYGSWGLMTHIHEEMSSKYGAMMNFIYENPAPWDECHLMP